jgi:integrase
MSGHIKKRGKNSWLIQIYTGNGPAGKYKRHYETVHGRKGDAQKRLTELLSSLDKGIYTPPGRLTVAEHLHNWLSGYVKTNCTQKTLDGYQAIIEKHLIPALGHIQLTKLHQQAIQKYYGEACERFNPRTVHHYHRVLSEALKYAVRQGYLGRNPCELVDAPSFSKKTMRTLTPEEVEILLGTAKDNYYYPVIYTAISTGLRQAELLGLRWRDLDFDTASLSVNQVYYKHAGVSTFKEPKTAHSRRRVAMTNKLVKYLRTYKTGRGRYCLELGSILSPDDLIFTSIEGNPIDPSVLSHNFKRVVEKANLKNIRFPDLRHTFASLMLLKGVAPKIISEALGHASVAFTMDTYSHIIEGMQSDAMSLLDSILPEGENGGFEKINDNLTTINNIIL